ncbi:MAG: Fe-S-containing protein [Candidatus Hodarchaeota archaeon]
MKENLTRLENMNEEKITRAEARILEKSQKKENWSFIKAIIIISIVCFASIVLLQTPNNDKVLTPTQEGDELVIQVSSLNSKAKFYGYNSESTLIKFFAVIGSDNNVHIAFDACDVCYSDKKGYTQDDTVMVCNNCGNKFLITGIGTENLQGGCWPSYLPVDMNTGQIRIKISDIMSKEYMFQ